MSSPGVSINPKGVNPSMSIERLNARMERLKLALNGDMTPERRAILQAELTKLEAVKNP